MNDPDQCVIRKYEKKDRQAVRDIAWETAFMGKPADAFFDDKEVLCDSLVSPFIDGESSRFCLVAEQQGRVVGYIIGSQSASKVQEFFARSIVPVLILKAFRRKTFFSAKNRQFLVQLAKSWLTGEMKTPGWIIKKYPAVLHINFLGPFRGLGLGKRSISEFIKLLPPDCHGVHLCTVSESSKIFFEKQGFNVIFRGQRSYWRYLSVGKINLYVLGRQIS